MQINPYLVFNGNCEAAFKFYERVLGGKIEMMMTYAGSPAEEHVSHETLNKIMHASLTVEDQVLMGSDAGDRPVKAASGFSVSIQLEDVTEAKRIFNEFSENGNITMPFGETFWAEGFGMLVDQFGTPWMVNCPKAPHS